MFSISAILLAFLLGFLPILIWLGFWLLQDQKRPEPRRLIVGAFFFGMLAVPLSILVQGAGSDFLNIDISALSSLAPLTLFLVFLFWAGIEEVFKILLVCAITFRKTAVDEPLDIPIYLITAALGFAALENTLFLISPLSSGDLVQSFLSGNMRFVGATLIHTLATAVVGGALALSFYKPWVVKIQYGIIALGVATIIHALFNFAILSIKQDFILTVFSAVWVGIVFFLVWLEYIKRLERPVWWKKIFISKK